jgi:hypothetical protein
MGIHKEIQNIFGSSVRNYVISARVAQGYEEWNSSTKEERLDIINRWNERKHELQSEKQRVQEQGPEGQGTGYLSPRGLLQTRHFTFDERKKLHEDRKAKRSEQKTKNPLQWLAAHSSQAIEPQTVPADARGLDYEEAIRESVTSTSTGDPEEDLIIERALRASVRELQAAEDAAATEEETLLRAIRASVSEASSEMQRPPGREYTTNLEQVIRQSLHDVGVDAADPNEHIDGEELRLAIEAAKTTVNVSEDADVGDESDEDMKLAKQASLASHNEHTLASKAEEERVLEYVKKQSLQEEGYRQASKGLQEAAGEDIDEDEALHRAIEESLKTKEGKDTPLGADT